MKNISLFILLVSVCMTGAYAQECYKIMFYNTENLFDAENDSLYDDEEFLPDGPRRWTNSRYQKKLDAVSKTIIAAGGWQFPDIVGLCEIENKKVIASLAHREMLVDAGYSFVHYDSPDQRGIDICMLYRTGRIKMITSENWTPVLINEPSYKARNILFVKTKIKNNTVDFILCHLPSKREGEQVSAGRRKVITGYLKNKIDSVNRSSNGEEKIILMGDFNSTPEDIIIGEISKSGSLVNLADSLSANGEGTYRFRGKWEMLDQIIVSKSLLAEKKEKSDKHNPVFNVLKFDFLLQDDPGFPGKRPFSTYKEYRWQGGFSDHLPVILTLFL